MKLLFIIVFVVFKLLTTISAQPEGTPVDGVIAIVGKNIVLKSEIETLYQQSIMQGEKPGDILRCELVEELLMQNLLLNQAQFDSITVSSNEIEAEMERRLRYFISQIGSREALEEYYNKSILEIKAEFTDMIKEQMLIQKMQQNITADVNITPKEVKKYYASLTEEEIPIVEMQFKLAHLVVMPKVNDIEKELVRNKIADYRERILKGDEFGTLAYMYSEDPGSSKRRGELGFFARGEMFPEFEAAAFKLQTPGEISPIIETKAGYHILQLIERRGELVNVRHILLMIKPGPTSVMQARNKIDSIHALIETEQLSFEEAVEIFSEEESKKNNGMMINPYSLDNIFPASQMDASMLFAVEKLKEGEVSDVVSFMDDMNNSGYRIIFLITKTEPHQANLTDDYSFIKELAMDNKKQKELNKWIIQKKKQTYISIFEPYKDCDFIYSW